MRIVLLILVVLALDCTPADDRPLRTQSTLRPSIVTSTVSSTPPVNPASIPVIDSSALAKASDTRPGLKPTVRLVDYAVHGGDMTDTVAKVEVTLGSAVDTIPGVLTSLSPIATNDGMVHGIAMTGEGFVSRGYDYNARTRKLTVLSLPPDVNPYNQDIELNDDAQFVAYIANANKTWAVVRSWPSMAEVARTLPSEGFPSDNAGDNLVGWTGLYQFQFHYRISSGPVILVEGDAQRRTIKVDTLSTVPN
jgi:hypothetical protein